MADLNEVLTQTLSKIGEEDDDRVYCTINERTRKITVPSSISIFAVAGDANTNRIWFKAPKTVGDGFDLTKCTIRINYITPAGDKGTFYTQYFEQVDDNVIFSWLISRQAVRTKGTLSFVVCAIQTDENGVITDEWNSAVATAKVLAGVEPDEQETDDQVTDAVAHAKASAASAESYALRAETAANQAIESEENAGRSEDNAKESETNAKTSETNAGTSEENALTSAQNAASSETNAAASAVNAKASEEAAAGSAANAAVSETNAKTSETNAAQSEMDAKASETAAESSENAAKASETNANASAINAASSEASAAESEANARTSETNAKNSETNSAQSEANAKASETTAKSSEQAAKASETNAANSETNAALSATKAAESETSAKTSEKAANGYKNNAAESAQQALNSQNAAEDAKEVAVVAQGKAEMARDAAIDAAKTAAADVQTSLAGYVSAAETAQENAEAARTDAENAKTAAEAAAASAADIAIANAETSLNSYVTAAQTAQGKAESAQAAASASETNAAGSATAAAGSAADAKNTADSISNSLEQINTNKNDISALATDQKRLWKLNQGISYDFETDDDEAHSKMVPTAAKVASMEAIGGKTIVWNQIINIPAGWQEVKRVNNNFVYPIVFHASHKYYIHEEACPSNSDYSFNYTSLGVWSSDMSRYVRKETLQSRSNNSCSVICTFTPPNDVDESTYTKFVFQYIVNSSTTDIDSYIEYQNFKVIDLTKMFGSGNEPSTVEEFEAMFPEEYYPYNSGELMSIDTKSVVVEGRNLWSYGDITVTNATGRTAFSSPLKAGTYTISADITSDGSDSNLLLWTYDSSGGNPVNISIPISKNTSKTFTLSTDRYYFSFYSQATGSTSVGKTSTISNIQLVKGSTVYDYVAYHTPVALSVPSSVPVLHSAGNVHDEIVYNANAETWSYIKRVGSVDLGALTWGYINASGGTFESKTIINDTALNNNCICNKYTRIDKPTSANMELADDAIAINNASGNWSYGSVVIKDTDYTSTTEFKNAVSGVMLYYELAASIEADITSEMSSFAPVECESSGTITFIGAGVDNEGNQILAADEHGVRVPNSVEYLISLAEVNS